MNAGGAGLLLFGLLSCAKCAGASVTTEKITGNGIISKLIHKALISI